MRVIVESPYRAETPAGLRRNMDYLSAALRDCIRRGDSPIASHGLLTFVLDDADEEERRQGIELGQEWIPAAHVMAVYEDYGITRGMDESIKLARANGIPVARRKILSVRP